MRAASAERLANLLFSLCCVALLGAGAMRYRTAPVHAAREHVIEAGSPDPFAVAAGADTPRLYVFISAGCQPCRDSLPFYKRLLGVTPGAAAMVTFVGLEAESQLLEFLRQGGVAGARVASVLRPANIPGSPTVVAVGTSRRVERSWAGRLGPSQEQDVIAFVRGAPEVRRSTPTADAAPLLARARAALSGTRQIDSVTGLDISGSDTQLHDTGARDGPYAFTLAWPDRLELRIGPVLHTLAGTVYSRRLADPNRFGGPMIDRLMNDPRIIATATSGMHWHLLRLSLTYLARAPADVFASDEGIRDFGQLKGRTVGFRDRDGRLQAQLVLDPESYQPLGLATSVHTIGGAVDRGDSTWISLFGDYRLVAGVRLPHRIDEWNGFSHSRVMVTAATVVTR